MTSQEKDKETGTERMSRGEPGCGGVCTHPGWGEGSVCGVSTAEQQEFVKRAEGGEGGASLTLLGTVRLQCPIPAGCGSFCKWILPTPEKAPNVRVVCHLSSSLHLFLPSCLEHCPPVQARKPRLISGVSLRPPDW